MHRNTTEQRPSLNERPSRKMIVFHAIWDSIRFLANLLSIADRIWRFFDGSGGSD